MIRYNAGRASSSLCARARGGWDPGCSECLGKGETTRRNASVSILRFSLCAQIGGHFLAATGTHVQRGKCSMQRDSKRFRTPKVGGSNVLPLLPFPSQTQFTGNQNVVTPCSTSAVQQISGGLASRVNSLRLEFSSDLREETLQN